MIGFAEIIFSLIIFSIIWYIIFKVKIIKEEKELLKNITEKIEKQDKIFSSKGKEIKLLEELKLKIDKVPTPEINKSDQEKGDKVGNETAPHSRTSKIKKKISFVGKNPGKRNLIKKARERKAKKK